MSEKRFYLDEEDRLCIHYDDRIVACVGCRETEAEKIVDLLNEMSERIDEQQSFIGRKLLGFDKYLAERLNEKEEIIKEQETIINQLDKKIKDKNEYQQVLESKIRRLKDRIKVLEK